MKKKLNDSMKVVSPFMLITILLSLVFTACSRNTAHMHDTYTCPMHPTVISDRPGTCPVCGMDLVRKARPGETVTISGDVAKLLKSPDEQITSSIKTLKGRYERQGQVLSAPGIVTYDSRNAYSIPSRVAGRLEKVYAKSLYQEIKRGQKVAEVYSPELIAAERELLFVVQHEAAGSELITGAKQKLKFLGLSEADIERIVSKGSVEMRFSIYSPYSGYVVSKENKMTPSATTVASPVASGGMKGMAGSSANTQAVSEKTGNASQPSFLKEGDYVSSGEVLFDITDSRSLRVELKVLASTGIKNGDTVILRKADGLTVVKRVDFVQPFFSDQEQFSTIRIIVSKTDDFQVGQWVNGEIHLRAAEGLWVPLGSVFDTGLDKVVFVKEKNVFHARSVSVGTTSGDEILIVHGLSSADEIAANASYLVDSESFVKYEQ